MFVRAEQKARVVLCGVGQFGSIVTAICVEKKWPIVAAFNRKGDKTNKDLGRVAGLNRDLGVIVRDIDAFDGEMINADVAIVTQTNVLSVNFPVYEKLIRAGLNIICLGTESYLPWSCNPAVAARIDALAKEHDVTFTGSGIWDMSRIWSGILMAGACSRLESLTHRSVTNIAGQVHTAQQAVEVAGIGLTVEAFKAQGYADTNPISLSYRTICEMVVLGLGYSIKHSEAWVEPAVLDAPLDSEIFGRTIPVGDCVGSRVVSQLETHEGLTASAQIDLRLCQPGEIEHTYWEIDGKPSNRMRLERSDSRHASPAVLINRVPDVMAARPGIVTIMELGPIRHTAFL
jgi:2,4-diaminopentanoate dehydrogenase